MLFIARSPPTSFRNLKQIKECEVKDEKRKNAEDYRIRWNIYVVEFYGVDIRQLCS